MKFRLKLIPEGTRIGFVRARFFAFAISGFLALASIALFMVHGLNYGIDFSGGTLLELGTDGPADLAKMRKELDSLGLGDVSIQEFGSPNDVLIRIEKQKGADDDDQTVVALVRDKLTQDVDPNIEFRRAEFVGPQVSDELKTQGFMAVSFAIIAVLIYIWFRFEWQFGLGAVAALVHDVTMTIGFFSLTGLEFNLPVIAAILTIVGYSLNDTVVVYDRIRENLRRYKKMPMKELLDVSINETLSRTVVTALTTLLALIALAVLGGPVIRDFSLAMLFGVVVGTYSSIYIASPILLMFKVRDGKAKAESEGESKSGARA
jgi:preprotein translocase SecF subunit